MAEQSGDRGLRSTRSQVLQYLQSLGGSRDAATIARALALKTTTVRFHLESLTDDGFVTKASADPDGQGRPRMLYRTTSRAPQVDTGPLRGLISFLIRRVVGESKQPGATAERLGRSWGRELAESERLAEPREDAVDSLIRHTSKAGFDVEAEADGTTLAFHSCPYRSLDAESLAAVCSMHLGMMRGHLAAQDSPVKVLDLVPGQTCIATLAR